MSREAAERAVEAGRRAAHVLLDQGVDLLAPGGMGIGNTTCAIALLCAMTGGTRRSSSAVGPVSTGRGSRTSTGSSRDPSRGMPPRRRTPGRRWRATCGCRGSQREPLDRFEVGRGLSPPSGHEGSSPPGPGPAGARPQNGSNPGNTPVLMPEPADPLRGARKRGLRPWEPYEAPWTGRTLGSLDHDTQGREPNERSRHQGAHRSSREFWCPSTAGGIATRSGVDTAQRWVRVYRSAGDLGRRISRPLGRRPRTSEAGLRHSLPRALGLASSGSWRPPGLRHIAREVAKLVDASCDVDHLSRRLTPLVGEKGFILPVPQGLKSRPRPYPPGQSIMSRPRERHALEAVIQSRDRTPVRTLPDDNPRPLDRDLGEEFFPLMVSV